MVFLPQRDHLVITGSDARARRKWPTCSTPYLACPAPAGAWLATDEKRPGPSCRARHPRQAAPEAVAQDANDQKKASTPSSKDGTDIFVGTTLFTEDDDGKPAHLRGVDQGADT